jgi:Ca2+-transporting ATPase
MDFYNTPVDKVLEHFKVEKDKGLDGHKVQSRQELYGKNELKSGKKINPAIIFLRQFKSFIIYILLFALIISIVVGEVVDSIVILAILLFNAFFGFIQEYKAEKAIAALKKLSALQARVIRGGKTVMIDAREIVPGDILVLEEGDKIPADARVIETVNHQTLESS